MKSVDSKSSTYPDYNISEINNRDSKFKVGDIVSILKCKNIFVIVYTPNWSKKFL